MKSCDIVPVQTTGGMLVLVYRTSVPLLGTTVILHTTPHTVRKLITCTYHRHNTHIHCTGTAGTGIHNRYGCNRADAAAVALSLSGCRHSSYASWHVYR